MSSNSESQCYFIQLQIDQFLDGELGQAQQEVFTQHLQQCQACAQEYHFAQVMHDSIIELPQIDCDDAVLEPVYQQASKGQSKAVSGSAWDGIIGWLRATPMVYRVAAPITFVAVLGVYIGLNVTTDYGPGVANQQAANVSPPTYSQEDVVRALQDLNVAIEYLNEVGQRTEVMIGDRFLLTPLQESLNASFESIREDGPRQNDPIY